CMGVARMLLLEINKERAREQLALGELPSPETGPAEDASGDLSEARLECLRSCLQGLSAANRELIIGYYQGEKGAKISNRKRLTEEFGVGLNTLRMRALRLREKLQGCVEDCMQK